MIKKKNVKIIAIIGFILYTLFIVSINNVLVNNKISHINYNVATANSNSNLVSNYIREGITIGGVTGTLKVESAGLSAYPIGSYYWSSNATNPSEIFGGEWEQIKDTFVLAAGDNHNVGETGGEETHILTQQELPNYQLPETSLTGSFGDVYAGSSLIANGVFSSYTTVTNRYYSQISQSGPNAWRVYQFNGTHTHNSGGSNMAHNNMPPYLVAYCWKRIA